MQVKVISIILIFSIFLNITGCGTTSSDVNENKNSNIGVKSLLIATGVILIPLIIYPDVGYIYAGAIIISIPISIIYGIYAIFIKIIN
jgi:hypothetical protein